MIFQIFCQKGNCELVVENPSVFNKKSANKYVIYVEARRKNFNCLSDDYYFEK